MHSAHGRRDRAEYRRLLQETLLSVKSLLLAVIKRQEVNPQSDPLLPPLTDRQTDSTNLTNSSLQSSDEHHSDTNVI
jgi:hypothetical protein